MKKILISTLLIAMMPAVYADDLLQIYQMAKQNDARLREAIAILDAQKEARPLAWAQLLPNVGIDGDLAYQSQNIRDSAFSFGTGRESSDSSSLSLNVVQPLYRRDRLMRLDQADWTVEQAQSDYLVVEQDLILRTAQAYFDILEAQDTLEFQLAEKKAIERQLDQAKQRFEVGLIAITGVHEAQARYDQANTAEIVAHNQMSANWEALREIIYDRPQGLSVLKEEIPLTPPMPAVLDEWSAKAMENSPAIRSASDATQIAQKEIDVQYSGHFPTLDAFASYGVSRSGAELGSDVDTGTIGLRLNVPLYSGGGVSATTRQAGHQLLAAQERLDQVRRAVDRQVRDSYRDVQASVSAVKSLRAGTISAGSALEATTAGFDVGTRTLVDVLNSQSDLFQAGRDYSQARYAYLLSGLSLKRAAGVLKEEDLAQLSQLLEQPKEPVN